MSLLSRHILDPYASLIFLLSPTTSTIHPYLLFLSITSLHHLSSYFSLDFVKIWHFHLLSLASTCFHINCVNQFYYPLLITSKQKFNRQLPNHTQKMKWCIQIPYKLISPIASPLLNLTHLSHFGWCFIFTASILGSNYYKPQSSKLKYIIVLYTLWVGDAWFNEDETWTLSFWIHIPDRTFENFFFPFSFTFLERWSGSRPFLLLKEAKIRWFLAVGKQGIIIQ